MPAALARLAHRLTEPPRYYLGGLWKRLFEMPVPVWCQALAFKALVTILPLILIATGVFGLVLRQENPFETVANYLRTFLPTGQSEGLIRLLSELQSASGAITVFGVLFFLAAIITFFSALRYVVATAMGGNRETYRSILGGYAFDLRMVLQVGLLFLLSFGLTFFINSLSTTSTAFLADLGLDPELLKRGWRIVLRATTLLVPFAISLLMFTQLYYFIPRP
ncbi:MAG: YhjD/YihY/BrkB family envelope integrity protein, partial [Rhodothermales bacterium]|nr:YhjD/YihY/BrkB family envelope integrity protein [Rhodothermales bacterium]